MQPARYITTSIFAFSLLATAIIISGCKVRTFGESNRKSGLRSEDQVTLVNNAKRVPGASLKSFEDLAQRTNSEFANRVKGAKVVFANYKMLQTDFPYLNCNELQKIIPSLADKQKSNNLPLQTEECHKIIDNWLLDNVAFVSATQQGNNKTNTPIPVENWETEVYRPPSYGRAFVTDVKRNRLYVRDDKPEGVSEENKTIQEKTENYFGLLDIKGTGVRFGSRPSQSSHANGLAALGEVIREWFFYEKLRTIFNGENGYWTLPHYAVISFPFSVIYEGGFTVPAGALVRRAHLRPPGTSDSVYEKGSQYSLKAREGELKLREFGFTSSAGTKRKFSRKNGKLVQVAVDGFDREVFEELNFEGMEVMTIAEGAVLEFDLENFQQTFETTQTFLQVLDYGAFEWQNKFTKPLISSELKDKYTLPLLPSQKSYLQPSKLASEIVWGKGKNSKHYAHNQVFLNAPSFIFQDTPAIEAFGLAKDFASNTIERAVLERRATLFLKQDNVNFLQP